MAKNVAVLIKGSLAFMGAFLCFGVIAAFGSGHARAETGDADVSASINSAIAVSLTNCDNSSSEKLSLQLTPTPTGTFTSNCQIVNVNTNTPGYTLTAKSSSTTLDYLNPTNIAPTPAVASTASLITAPTVLPVDTWGFAVENNGSFDTTYTANAAANKYAALPTSDVTIYEAKQLPSSANEHRFFYGANITTDNVAGMYSATVTYTAIGADVPEPKVYLAEVVRKNRVTNMQALTSALCMAAEYDSANGGANDNNTVVLNDIRDNKGYRVRKMPDNRCWLIDDLKLELASGMTLTPTSTNVTADVTIYFTKDGRSTGAALPGMTGNFTTSGYMTRDGTDLNPPPNYDAWRQADPNSTANCRNNTGTDTTNTYNPSSGISCGYLYNWYTASAGTKPQSVGASYATESICPANWSLPISASANDFAILNNSMKNGSLSAESFNSSYYANWLPDGVFEGSLSGHYSLSLYYQGQEGFYWSGHALTATTADIVSLSYNSVNPGAYGNKHGGNAVRCVL